MRDDDSDVLLLLTHHMQRNTLRILFALFHALLVDYETVEIDPRILFENLLQARCPYKNLFRTLALRVGTKQI